MTNERARGFVTPYRAEVAFNFCHNAMMARRGIPKGPVNWYLKEWMDSCGLTGRGAQARMMERTGWTKASMSQLYNGTQDYSPRIINDAAAALQIEPFELLLPPERAMNLRRLQAAAEGIVRSVTPPSAGQAA
jgi:hypothetical protein